MALVLNEEQQSLKDIAKEFLQKNAPVTHFREIRDTENELGYDQDLWKQMVDLDGPVFWFQKNMVVLISVWWEWAVYLKKWEKCSRPLRCSQLESLEQALLR